MQKPSVVVLIVLVGAGAAGAAPPLPHAAPRAEIVADWIAQDGGSDAKRCFTAASGATLEEGMVELVLGEVGKNAARGLRAELTNLSRSGAPGQDRRWRELYIRACEARRAALHPRLRGPPGRAAQAVARPLQANRLHQAPHVSQLERFLHRGPVRRAEPAELHAGLGPVRTRDGRPLRQDARPAGRRRGHDPRPGRTTASGSSSRGSSRGSRTTTTSTRCRSPPARQGG